MVAFCVPDPVPISAGLSMCPADLASAGSMCTPEPTSYLNHCCVNLEGWRKLRSSILILPISINDTLLGLAGWRSYQGWPHFEQKASHRIKRKERLSVREPPGRSCMAPWGGPSLFSRSIKPDPILKTEALWKLPNGYFLLNRVFLHIRLLHQSQCCGKNDLWNHAGFKVWLFLL